jgi:hypothetical protein
MQLSSAWLAPKRRPAAYCVLRAGVGGSWVHAAAAWAALRHSHCPPHTSTSPTSAAWSTASWEHGARRGARWCGASQVVSQLVATTTSAPSVDASLQTVRQASCLVQLGACAPPVIDGAGRAAAAHAGVLVLLGVAAIAPLALVCRQRCSFLLRWCRCRRNSPAHSPSRCSPSCRWYAALHCRQHRSYMFQCLLYLPGVCWA